MKRKNPISLKAILFFYLIKCSCIVVGEEINNLTINDGLPTNGIRCILIDQRNYLWLGTQNGVSFYNGSFTNYNAKVGIEGELQSSKIFDLVEDSENNIWIAGKNCLEKYNQRTGKFSHTFIVDGTEKLLEGKVSSLFYDTVSNRLWVAIKGLGVYYRENNKFKLFSDVNHNKILRHVNKIKKGRSGKLYLAGRESLVIMQGKKVCKYDYTTDLAVKDIVEIKGNIVLATNKGLYHYNADNDFIKQLNLQEKDFALYNYQCNAILKIKDELWVATDGGGIRIINWNDLTVQKFTKDEGLTGNAISKLYKDINGNIYVTTYHNGVNIIDTQKRIFRTTVKNPACKTIIKSLLYTSSNHLLVGSDGNGIFVYAINHNKEVSEKSRQILPSGNITSMAENSKGDVYIAVYRSGIYKYNVIRNELSVISKECQNVWKLCCDKNDNVWITTINNGVLFLDSTSKEIKKILDINCTISAITYKDDKIYIGTENKGIGVINLNGKVDKYYSHCHIKQLNGNFIKDILIDNDTIWYSVENVGLVLFDKKNEKYKIFDVAHGLPNSSVQCISKHKNNLWLGTNNGLCQYNIATSEYYNYYQHDGLISSQFTSSDSYVEGNNIYMATTDGCVVFIPQQIETRKVNSKVNITDFQILQQENDEDDKKVQVIGDKYSINSITLPHNYADFNIDYTCPEIILQDAVEYAYRLKNFNSTWNYVGKRKTAIYTNIPPGEYVFEVKAGIDNNWNDEIDTIRIVIKKPWWVEWYAIIGYLCILSLISWLIYRSARERLILKKQIKISQLKKEHEEILNNEKTKFFINVSHEFRTPLSLIYGCIEELLKTAEHDENKIKRNLNNAFHNCNRLLRLVNELINFRKLESNKVTLKVQSCNVKNVVNEIVEGYQISFDTKQITFHKDLIMEDEICWLDIDKFEMIISNLISNALKFTPNSGDVTLQIKKQNNKLLVSVKDSGCGISEHDQAHIFERFYVGSSQEGNKTSSGIGLSLVKQFVEIHKGVITLESQLGKGSIFNIVVPCNKSDYTQTEIIESKLDFSKGELIKPTVECTNGKMIESAIKKQSVLIIEDNDELRHFLADNLKDQYNVKEAEDGQIALQMLTQFVPDIIICDIMMPKIEGIEVCKRIKNDNSVNHIPIIVLTAKTTEETHLSALKVGADDFVTKPFSVVKLRAKIESILDNRQRVYNYLQANTFHGTDVINAKDEDKDFIIKFKELLHKNINNIDFDIPSVAKEMNMTRQCLNKKIKKLFDVTPFEFLHAIRMEKAAVLLKEKKLTVNEIAFEVGYNDIKTFRNNFKKFYGKTPSEYKKGKSL